MSEVTEEWLKRLEIIDGVVVTVNLIDGVTHTLLSWYVKQDVGALCAIARIIFIGVEIMQHDHSMLFSNRNQFSAMGWKSEPGEHFKRSHIIALLELGGLTVPQEVER